MVPDNRYLQQGFSLIEILVSLVVLATGILGLTSLQSTALQNSSKSVSRTQAAYMSYEILDRIRANPSQTYSVAAAVVPNHENCFTNSCTPAQLMAFDLAEWKCSFNSFHQDQNCTSFFNDSRSTLSQDNVLLDGDGTVSCLIQSGEKICSVNINWRERENNDAGFSLQSYSVSVIL